MFTFKGMFALYLKTYRPKIKTWTIYVVFLSFVKNVTIYC